MKKVYMPSDELLKKMQESGGNIYKYLLVKAYEALIIEGKNYYNKGILKNAYKYFREDPYLATAICLLYPEEIAYSEVASNDPSLAKELINKKEDNTIYNLDNLTHFDESIGSNVPLIRSTVSMLDEYLPQTPNYRFDYKDEAGHCHLVDDIFSTRILKKNIFWGPTLKEQMSRIEPAYALLIPTISYQDDFIEQTSRKQMLKEGITAYASRYSLNDAPSREVDLDNPDKDVKRLIRCIKNNNHNLY